MHIQVTTKQIADAFNNTSLQLSSMHNDVESKQVKGGFATYEPLAPVIVNYRLNEINLVDDVHTLVVNGIIKSENIVNMNLAGIMDIVVNNRPHYNENLTDDGKALLKKMFMAMVAWQPTELEALIKKQCANDGHAYPYEVTKHLFDRFRISSDVNNDQWLDYALAGVDREHDADLCVCFNVARAVDEMSYLAQSINWFHLENMPGDTMLTLTTDQSISWCKIHDSLSYLNN